MEAVNYVYRAGEPVPSNAAVGDASHLINETLIGVSSWAVNARRLVASYAAQDKTVALEGEPGTGKRLLAALIHRCSPRTEGPFVSLSLGLAGDELARSVLLGWPNSTSGEKGLLELTQKGTLYLRRLPDAFPSFTDDVVRWIERTRFNSQNESSVRIVFGWDVQSEFYRSNRADRVRKASGFEVLRIPPLRERSDDIEALALHFIEQRCREIGKEVRTLSTKVTNALVSYDWPRNVRELRTLVNRLVCQSPPPSIDISLLPVYMLGQRDGSRSLLPAMGLDMANEVRQYEIDLICAALKESRGLQNKAAQLLRIKPTTLFMKIRRYGIATEAFK